MSNNKSFREYKFQVTEKQVSDEEVEEPSPIHNFNPSLTKKQSKLESEELSSQPSRKEARQYNMRLSVSKPARGPLLNEPGGGASPLGKELLSPTPFSPQDLNKSALNKSITHRVEEEKDGTPFSARSRLIDTSMMGLNSISSPEPRSALQIQGSRLEPIKSFGDAALRLVQQRHSAQSLAAFKTKRSRKKSRPDLNFKMDDVKYPLINDWTKLMGRMTKEAIIKQAKKEKQRRSKSVSTNNVIFQSKLAAASHDDKSEKKPGASPSEKDLPVVRETSSISSNMQKQLQRVLMHPGFEDMAVDMTELHNRERSMMISQLKINKSVKSPLETYINNHIIVSTTSFFYQTWKIVILVMSFISAFFYAFYMVIISHPLSTESQQWLNWISQGCQYIFAFDLILQFFVEIPIPGTQEFERNIGEIAKAYLQDAFFFDLVALVPFYDLLPPWRNKELVFLVRLLRLHNGFTLLDYKIAMKEVRQYQQKQVEKLITTNDPKAQNQVLDQAKVSLLIFLKQLMQTLQLIFVVLCLSFLTGMVWWKFCDILEENFEMKVTFTSENGFSEKEDAAYTAIAMAYFMITSLSTVGLGDYHPVNSAERTLGAVVLLFGVLITSYVMERIATMLKNFQGLNKDFEESSQLSLFLSVIRSFNSNQPLPKEINQQIEQYFVYRWSHDRNQAIRSYDEIAMLEQLPKSTQHAIFIEFLFKKVMTNYDKTLAFDIPALQVEQKTMLQKMKIFVPDSETQAFINKFSTYSSTSTRYSQLIVNLLSHLEPRALFEEQVLFEEETEISEVVFFLNGRIEVGYNKQRAANRSMKKENASLAKLRKSVYGTGQIAIANFNFPVTLYPGQCVVGMFEMIYSVNSRFMYKTGHMPKALRDQSSFNDDMIHCFFLRKANLKKALLACQKPTPEVPMGFKMRMLLNYLNRIFMPIQMEQTRIEIKRELLQEKVRNYIPEKIRDITMEKQDLIRLNNPEVHGLRLQNIEKELKMLVGQMKYAREREGPILPLHIRSFDIRTNQMKSVLADPDVKRYFLMARFKTENMRRIEKEGEILPLPTFDGRQSKSIFGGSTSKSQVQYNPSESVSGRESNKFSQVDQEANSDDSSADKLLVDDIDLLNDIKFEKQFLNEQLNNIAETVFVLRNKLFDISSLLQQTLTQNSMLVDEIASKDDIIKHLQEIIKKYQSDKEPSADDQVSLRSLFSSNHEGVKRAISKKNEFPPEFDSGPRIIQRLQFMQPSSDTEHIPQPSLESAQISSPNLKLTQNVKTKFSLKQPFKQQPTRNRDFPLFDSQHRLPIDQNDVVIEIDEKSSSTQRLLSKMESERVDVKKEEICIDVEDGMKTVKTRHELNGEPLSMEVARENHKSPDIHKMAPKPLDQAAFDDVTPSFTQSKPQMDVQDHFDVSTEVEKRNSSSVIQASPHSRITKAQKEEELKASIESIRDLPNEGVQQPVFDQDELTNLDDLAPQSISNNGESPYQIHEKIDEVKLPSKEEEEEKAPLPPRKPRSSISKPNIRIGKGASKEHPPSKEPGKLVAEAEPMKVEAPPKPGQAVEALEEAKEPGLIVSKQNFIPTPPENPPVPAPSGNPQDVEVPFQKQETYEEEIKSEIQFDPNSPAPSRQGQIASPSQTRSPLLGMNLSQNRSIEIPEDFKDDDGASDSKSLVTRKASEQEIEDNVSQVIHSFTPINVGAASAKVISPAETPISEYIQGEDIPDDAEIEESIAENGADSKSSSAIPLFSDGGSQRHKSNMQIANRSVRPSQFSIIPSEYEEVQSQIGEKSKFAGDIQEQSEEEIQIEICVAESQSSHLSLREHTD